MSAIAQPLTIARIALALSQAEYPLPHDLYADLPLIEDWLCLQDGLLLRVHGRIHEGEVPPRHRLSAAVIAVETAHGRIIRCVDGDYRLGQPRALPADTQVDGPTPPPAAAQLGAVLPPRGPGTGPAAAAGRGDGISPRPLRHRHHPDTLPSHDRKVC